MRRWWKWLHESPSGARVVPFVLFVLLTTLQGYWGEGSRYWLYLVKTGLAGWMLWGVWQVVPEMRWVVSWEGVVVGAGVFGLWVGLEGMYPTYVVSAAWNPNSHFGEGSALALAFIGVRLIGSTLVVPPLEEVFYRSFLYRWIAHPNFQEIPLGRFLWMPFVVTSLIFGLVHFQWLAGILCGAAYQGLVCWKKRLGDAMTAHAVTNLLLGGWVIGNGEWHFW